MNSLLDFAGTSVVVLPIHCPRSVLTIHPSYVTIFHCTVLYTRQALTYLVTVVNVPFRKSKYTYNSPTIIIPVNPDQAPFQRFQLMKFIRLVSFLSFINRYNISSAQWRQCYLWSFFSTLSDVTVCRWLYPNFTSHSVLFFHLLKHTMLLLHK